MSERIKVMRPLGPAAVSRVVPQAVGHNRPRQRQHRSTVDPGGAAFLHHSPLSACPSALRNAGTGIWAPGSMKEEPGHGTEMERGRSPAAADAGADPCRCPARAEVGCRRRGRKAAWSMARTPCPDRPRAALGAACLMLVAGRPERIDHPPDRYSARS